MPYQRTDDRADAMACVQELSLAAWGLISRATNHCAAVKSDGVVHRGWVRERIKGREAHRAARELAEKEYVPGKPWWRRLANGGYEIVGYLDPDCPLRQRSKAQIKADTESSKRRQDDYRERQKQQSIPWDGAGAEAPRNAVSNGPHPSIHPSIHPVEPPRPPALGAGGDGGAGDLWERTQADLRQHVTDYTFHIWLEPLTAEGFDGTTLTLRAPDSIVSWVRDRYLPLLRSAATKVHGAAVTVQIPETMSERRQRENEATAAARRQRRAAKAETELAAGGASPGDES